MYEGERFDLRCSFSKGNSNYDAEMSGSRGYTDARPVKLDQVELMEKVSTPSNKRRSRGILTKWEPDSD